MIGAWGKRWQHHGRGKLFPPFAQLERRRIRRRDADPRDDHCAHDKAGGSTTAKRTACFLVIPNPARGLWNKRCSGQIAPSHSRRGSSLPEGAAQRIRLLAAIRNTVVSVSMCVIAPAAFHGRFGHKHGLSSTRVDRTIDSNKTLHQRSAALPCQVSCTVGRCNCRGP